ncbi:MAG TPA: DUF1127 domain-containing protein [Dongiaceae bacterium]|nr:DUF1127 domain-containing protein [Dongiaceae bacterium]
MHTISREAVRSTALARPHRGRGWKRGAALLARICDAGLHWLELSRQRRSLQALDERRLKDIGLTRADVEREARKPFWRE